MAGVVFSCELLAPILVGNSISTTELFYRNMPISNCSITRKVLDILMCTYYVILLGKHRLFCEHIFGQICSLSGTERMEAKVAEAKPERQQQNAARENMSLPHLVTLSQNVRLSYCHVLMESCLNTVYPGSWVCIMYQWYKVYLIKYSAVLEYSSEELQLYLSILIVCHSSHSY